MEWNSVGSGRGSEATLTRRTFMTGTLVAALLATTPARHLLDPATAKRTKPHFVAHTPPAGRAGHVYEYHFVASGEPTYTVASGHLPPHVSLHPRTGLLSGTPRREGTATFRIKATNAAGSTLSPTLHLRVWGRDAAPVNVDRPVISNRAPRVGETISVSTGKWV